MLSIAAFAGHFHPLLVHLPIGILAIGLLLMWLARKDGFHPVRGALPVVLLSGAITAALSCITGFVLSRTDDYDPDTVGWHQWMGIATTVVSALLYARVKNPKLPLPAGGLAVALGAGLLVTGHLGGSLTHGAGYLTQALSAADFPGGETVRKPIANVQEAVLYTDIIQPIFAAKCYGCHNAGKRKGGLRMDDFEKLMAGGKDGKALLAGHPDSSELVRRALLPADNDDHMPPKEKPQLSESELALVQWWIATGADPVKKVKELPQPARIPPLLAALQGPTAPAPGETDELPANIPAAVPAVLDSLRAKGIVVLPVAAGTNALSVTCLTDSALTPADFSAFGRLSKQLVSIRLDHTNANDSALHALAGCTQLRTLNLARTRITDAGLAATAGMKELRYLNLVGTACTAAGVARLRGLPKLAIVYCYQSGVKPSDYARLKAALPHTTLDTGGYTMPFLVTDTARVRYVKPK